MRLCSLVLLISLFRGIACFGQSATFRYQYDNETAKEGRFVFTCPDESLSFTADASAGYLVASNNPYFQDTKEKGPIPNGSWIIYAIKDETKNILRLKATNNVMITSRDGFLIHGIGKDSTPEASSKGCIILDPAERKKLTAAFKKYGEIKVDVTNFTTSNGTDS